MITQRMVLFSGVPIVLFPALFFVYSTMTTPAGQNTPNGERLVTLAVGRHELLVEIADTPALRARGLSGRPMLESNRGMLFAFDEPGVFEFWMPDMRFPIDIIWIDEHQIVTEVMPSITPDTYPRRFTPKAPARYVLEVNAGWASAHGINAGVRVSW